MLIYKTNNAIEALLVLPFIASIDAYYPDIKEWYINTVVPGISTSDDVLLIAKEGSSIHGIALAKNSDECKLRCVRVSPDYQNSGLGIRLIDKALSLIGDKPKVSVCQELFHDYSRAFITRYNFELSSVIKGKYRQHKLEYYFNE